LLKKLRFERRDSLTADSRRTTTYLRANIIVKERAMKKTSLFGVVCMSLLVAVFMVAPRATAAGKMVPSSNKTFQTEHAADMRAQKMGETFTMSGTVKAVDSKDNTAVIECPVKGQMFTVAGPIAPKANLEKGGKAAQLSDFKEGQHVNVKWQATEQGHRILMLAAK
jgi:hypothetical protein